MKLGDQLLRNNDPGELALAAAIALGLLPAIWAVRRLEAQSEARFDRAHFKAYADFSLGFEVVYYVLSADYAVYMNVQQAINLAIFEKLANEGVQFAYPTRTLYVHPQGAVSP
jgi:small-conductance mechanosensitive channel